MPVDLSEHPQLAALYQAYVAQLSTHLRGARPYWNQAAGVHSGTLSNLEQGIAWMTTLGHASLDAGCVALQNQTVRALNGAGGASGWTIEKWRVGTSWYGHSAVAVYPAGGKPEDGYIFDAWLEQSPKVYGYAEWEKQFRVLGAMGKARKQ
ncbi:MAG: hypothetical protein KC503_43740 [Myxococcales bacterium]|nr:hypothetical protein [Myxococcales bacterium]